MPDPLLAAVASKLQAQEKRARWRDSPDVFMREAFRSGGEGSSAGSAKGGGVFSPAPYQLRALVALQRSGKLAVRSPHGAGKTTVAAWAILWFSISRELAGEDWKVVTTAGSWRQLERYLWPEVRSWTARLRWDVLGLSPWINGRDQFDLGLKLRYGQAFAVASDDPQLLEGAHASELLLVIDEAKAVPDATWDSVEGALSGGGGHAYALAVSTPGAPSGRFYEIMQRRPGLTDWAVQHISLQEAIEGGRISAEWAASRSAQWGPESSVYQNRVLGEFSTSDEDGLIPLAWIESANARWQGWQDLGAPTPGGRLILGVDVARFGADKTVIASRRGDYLTSVESFGALDTMQVTGQVMARLGEPNAVAVVDVIGLGSGVVDRLREQRKTGIEAFSSSGATSDRDRSGELGFLNSRAAAWWKMRELLDPANAPTLALPPDDQLIGDLCAPKWSITSAGKVQIESKDDLRKRLGRSTDVGDAVVMSFSVPATSYRGPLHAAIPWADHAGPGITNGAFPWSGGDQPMSAAEEYAAQVRWLRGGT